MATLALAAVAGAAWAGAVVAADGAGIPFRQSEGSGSEVLLRVLGGLVIAVLLGAGAIYALKRYLPSLYHPRFAGPGRIRLVEARRLTPGTTLFLVELDGTSLLLGQSGERITTLHERPGRAAHGDGDK